MAVIQEEEVNVSVCDVVVPLEAGAVDEDTLPEAEVSLVVKLV